MWGHLFVTTLTDAFGFDPARLDDVCYGNAAKAREEMNDEENSALATMSPACFTFLFFFMHRVVHRVSKF